MRNVIECNGIGRAHSQQMYLKYLPMVISFTPLTLFDAPEFERWMNESLVTPQHRALSPSLKMQNARNWACEALATIYFRRAEILK